MTAAELVARVRELSEPSRLRDMTAQEFARGLSAEFDDMRRNTRARCPECGADKHGPSCPFCDEGLD